MPKLDLMISRHTCFFIYKEEITIATTSSFPFWPAILKQLKLSGYHPRISLSQLVSVICQMFVCIVPLSQPSSRDLLYVKCLCVLSRYLSLVVEICYMLSVCVHCPVISA